MSGNERTIVSAGRFAIPVLYEDNHLLIAVKPPNMVVQADHTGDIDILTALKRYIGEKYQKPGAVYLGLVHRLDRPVGGVMAFARTSKAAARLSEQFAGHAAGKEYLAVAQGEFREPARLTDYLRKEPDGMVRVVAPDAPGAKRAVLTTDPIAARDGLTLTRVRLETGRAHQIRVQHQYAGHPLWGDARYGGGRPGQQIALWAHRLTLTHPTKKEPMSFECLPPLSGAWRAFGPELQALDSEAERPR